MSLSLPVRDHDFELHIVFFGECNAENKILQEVGGGHTMIADYTSNFNIIQEMRILRRLNKCVTAIVKCVENS